MLQQFFMNLADGRYYRIQPHGDYEDEEAIEEASSENQDVFSASPISALLYKEAPKYTPQQQYAQAPSARKHSPMPQDNQQWKKMSEQEDVKKRFNNSKRNSTTGQYHGRHGGHTTHLSGLTPLPKMLPSNRDNHDIYAELPMFRDKILYPEYDPKMSLIRKEGFMLKQYLQKAYGLKVDIGRDGLLNLPLSERWLKGEEYGFLLRHYKTYSRLQGFAVNEGCQDQRVYSRPQDIEGKVYFIKGMHLRHFGFPRLLEDDEGSMDSKKNNQTQLKKFLWKKTNFVTDLPKHMPIARYLVAKTSNLKDHFYMHVSILHNPNLFPII